MKRNSRMTRLEQRHGSRALQDMTDDDLDRRIDELTAALIGQGCTPEELTLPRLQVECGIGG